MLLHTVLFWLKKDLTPSQVEAFEGGLRSLTAIPTVRWSFVGRPAATDRPVIDRSYSYKLVVAFDDMQGHDDYQAIDTHTLFIANCSAFWDRVQIYDAE